MQRSTQLEAQQSKLTHSFLPGVGYLRHEAQLPKGPLVGRTCAPPPGTPNGSAHLLQPPKVGSLPLAFTWVEAERAWSRPGGFRLAFSEAHLASHGWTYVRPVN